MAASAASAAVMVIAVRALLMGSSPGLGIAGLALMGWDFWRADMGPKQSSNSRAAANLLQKLYVAVLFQRDGLCVIG